MALSQQAAQHTGPLTKAFGWKPEDLSAQQDVGELLHQLTDALLKQTQGSPIAEFVGPSMHGEQSSYLRCLTCESDRITQRESFLVASLSVDKASDLVEAVQNYVKPEVMDGDNALHCGSKCPELR